MASEFSALGVEAFRVWMFKLGVQDLGFRGSGFRLWSLQDS